MRTFNEWLKAQMPIPDDIKKIHSAFKDAGYQLKLVGGAVRDFVLGKKPKDYDLATDATPEEVKKILDQHHIPRTDEVGEQFGVVVAKPNDEPYEIATFRIDKEAGRNTAVEFVRDAKQDVLRRDLTMNALLYDLDTKEIEDHVGGVEDIKNNRVRVVGDPMQRFAEDPLRVLRLIRFHSRFNHTLEGIDLSTQQAILHFVKNGLTDSKGKAVPPERIRDEFKKGLASAQVPVNYLKLYDQFGLLRKYVLPGFPKYNTYFINSRDFYAVVAAILKTNKIDEVFENHLKEVIHETEDVERILYYIKMLNLKKGNRNLFKKLRGEEDLLVNLMHRPPNKPQPEISDEDLQQWAKWNHISMDVVKQMRDYLYKGRVADVPGASDLQGKLIGQYIKGYNTWKALRNMGRLPSFKEWLTLC